MESNLLEKTAKSFPGFAQNFSGLAQGFPGLFNDRSLYRRVFEWFAVIIFGAILVCYLAGCATRSYTTPHSELIEDAQDRGESVKTLDEQRKIFEKFKKENDSKLLQLIKRRQSSRKIKTDNDYVIGPLDVLEINVFGVPELNTQARVSQTGFVSLPLLGGVKVSGLSEKKARSELSGKLTQYVRSPEVAVSVVEFGSKQVSILGAVQEPGNILLQKGENSLLEVIGKAGGVSERAGSYLLLVPGDNAKGVSNMGGLSGSGYAKGKNGVEVPIEAIFGSGNQQPLSIPLVAGDSVIVPVAGQVVVEGEVERRGAYDLGGKMTLLGALAAAGGVTYSAKIEEVEVIRKIPGYDRLVLVYNLEKLASGLDTNILLKEGDIVRVPSITGKRIASDTFQSIQRMINFGVGSSYQFNTGGN